MNTVSKEIFMYFMKTVLSRPGEWKGWRRGQSRLEEGRRGSVQGWTPTTIRPTTAPTTPAATRNTAGDRSCATPGSVGDGSKSDELFRAAWGLVAGGRRRTGRERGMQEDRRGNKYFIYTSGSYCYY